nr:Zinc finger MYND domain containing protein 12 [Hymenolepis microstoma]
MTVTCPEEERRKKMEEIQSARMKMVELARTTAMKLLFNGNYETALSAALQCLKFSSELYGNSSAELVIPYLLIAEAYIGLKQLEEAESYLAQAQWIMFKTEHECSDAIRSAVQRKLGLLFAAKGEYSLALECLAQDVYYSSCAFGASHIRTAGGYFQMAEVYYNLYQCEKEPPNEANTTDICPRGMINPSATQQIPGFDSCRPMPPALPIKKHDSCEDISLSSSSPLFLSYIYKKPSVLKKPVNKDRVADDLYARVVHIWANHLFLIIATKYRVPSVPVECGPEFQELKPVEEKELDPTDTAEARKLLTAINKYRAQRAAWDRVEFNNSTAGRPDPRARLLLALSMLFWLIDEQIKARQYFDDAVIAVEKAEKSPKLQLELEFLKALFEQQPPKIKP